MITRSANKINNKNYRWQNIKKRRFYQVYLKKDLLNDWVLTCVWGSLDSRLGNFQHHAFKGLKEAILFINNMKELRQKRGYLLVS